MKKIGIMTHHKFYNAGTMLQAYALQKKIEMMGEEAEIINYTTETYRRTTKEKIFSILKNPYIIIEKITKKYEKKANKNKIELTTKAFDEFHKKIKTSKECFKTEQELQKNCTGYDIYMTGSDQTWNPYIPSNQEAYLLNFAPKDKIRVSYAPSIGGNNIPEKSKELFKTSLANFKNISCREKIGKEILENISNKKVELVLDPTFLLDKEQWNSISKEVSVDKKYLLCYFLGRNKQNITKANKIAKDKNLKIVSIYTMDGGKTAKSNLKFGIGPSEFLYLVNNAECVCTDSFHGVAFSSIFNKDFYAFKKRKDNNKSDNNRLIDLLYRLNLEDRLISNDTNIEYSNIDYMKVNEKLKQEKKKSEEYLAKCINS